MCVSVCGRATSGGTHSNSWCCVFSCCCCFFFLLIFVSCHGGKAQQLNLCADFALLLPQSLLLLFLLPLPLLLHRCWGGGWKARAQHTQTHTATPKQHTIYKNTYVSMYHTQIYVCVCVCVCVCFVGPQLLLAFIFSQLSQSCSSRQLENTHNN